MNKQQKIKYAVKVSVINFAIEFVKKVNAWSVPLALAGVIAFIISSISDTKVIITKIYDFISVFILTFTLFKYVIIKLEEKMTPLPVIETLETFYDSAFERAENLNNSCVRFIQDDTDLFETACLIQNNPSFRNQFKTDGYAEEKISEEESQKRILRRYELYALLNSITKNKAILQLFLPEGPRVGASVILPLKEQAYTKLINCKQDDALEVLLNFNSGDIELVNTNECFFLIDILIVDKYTKNKAIRMNETRYDYRSFLRGASLHLILWHLASLGKNKFLKLPNIIIQPDVFGMVHWTHKFAGFTKHNASGSPAPGEYIIMNTEIYERLKENREYKKCAILNRCLAILQSYQLIMGKS